MYICKTLKGIPGQENKFLVGAEDKSVTQVDLSNNEFTVTGAFTGHSMGIRSLGISNDAQTLATGCMDHSIRLWDYNSGIAQAILCGHQDVVVSILILY